MEKRIAYYDFLRGIAIIFVVGIHAYLQSSDSEICRFVRNLIGCAVPIFLAISGFFLSRKPVNTRQSYIDFLQRQVPKVYIPMLIWSLPMLVVVFSHGDNTLESLLLFLCGGLGVFYFIALIIQCYLILPIVKGMGVMGG